MKTSGSSEFKVGGMKVPNVSVEGTGSNKNGDDQRAKMMKEKAGSGCVKGSKSRSPSLGGDVWSQSGHSPFKVTG